MKAISWIGVMVTLVVAGTASASYFDQNFDGYALGTPFFPGTVNGWRASSASVVVTDASAYTLPKAVLLPAGTVLSNQVSVASPGVAWTDFRVRPTFGDWPLTVPSNTASFVFCFYTNRYLAVYTPAGWRSCTNDIWGNALSPLTTNWVNVSVYQNYPATTMVVFVDGRIALQDQNFVANPGAYNVFVADNVDSNVFLDDVYITNAYPSARLTADINGNGLDDGLEVHTYGYAGRPRTVGPGREFATIQAAVNAARPLDTIYLYNQVYSDPVIIAANTTFAGEAFTHSGSISVASGATLTLDQSATLSALSVTGTVVVAGSTQTVAALSLASVGTISVTNGRLVVASVGVDMSGTFSINGADWGADAVAAFPFEDNFEFYAASSLMQNLRFRGWGASSAGSTVVGSPVAGGARAAAVTGMVSNRVSGAPQKVWTDVMLRPVLGDRMSNAPTNGTAFAVYASTGGYPVYHSNGWQTIQVNAVGGAFAPMSASTFSRLTLFENFTTHYASLFLNGTLLVQRVSIPLSTYSGMGLLNEDGLAYIDTVKITALPPSDLLSDIDQDEWSDAQEVHEGDFLGAKMLRTSIFTFH